MKDETLQRAITVTALLHVVLTEIDELSHDGCVFKNSLKYSGKKFVAEIEKFMVDYYKNMEEPANLVYNKHIEFIEELLRAYRDGQIKYVPDEVSDPS